MRSVLVVLDVEKFRASAARVIRKPRVSWSEYTTFMRRCGFEAHRDDRHGFPRVCVVPFDGAPLIEDCLGMTERGTEASVERLYSAHVKHIARWVVTELASHSIKVTPAYWGRNQACAGFYVLAGSGAPDRPSTRSTSVRRSATRPRN
jgi:hypothetical protein